MIQHRYLVFISAYLCQAIFGGINYGSQRMLVAIMDTFRASRTQVGLIFSLMATFFCLTGIFTGAIVHKYGQRVTTVVGTALIVVSLCISFLATSVIFLVVTVGITTGTGISLMYISSTPVVCDYFKGRSQSMALTLLATGSGVGGAIFAYLVGFLTDNYGVRGTFLLIGGITLNTGVVTILWKSQSNKVKIRATPIAPINSVENPPVRQLESGEPRLSLKESFKNVLTNKAFVLFALGNGLQLATMNSATIYIVDTMVDIKNQLSFGSLAPFLFNLLGLLGRLLCGLLKQVPHLSSLDAGLLSTIFGVAGCLTIAFTSSPVTRVVAWSLNGISFGISVTSLSVTTAKLLGKQNLAKGMGIIMLILGIGNTIAGPLNGYIRDVTETYTPVFLGSSVIFVIGGIFILSARILRLRQ